jgi:hypothetical protein
MFRRQCGNQQKRAFDDFAALEIAGTANISAGLPFPGAAPFS